jgi:O-acetyl-ADP-ribose deacetylase (regulator of RNase III)
MSDEIKVKQGVIRIAVGDITELPVEGIVYYARPDLVLGSGFGGVIAAKGGPKIQEELKKFGRANTTDVVITSGGDLKAKKIWKRNFGTRWAMFCGRRKRAGFKAWLFRPWGWASTRSPWRYVRERHWRR